MKKITLGLLALTALTLAGCASYQERHQRYFEQYKFSRAGLSSLDTRTNPRISVDKDGRVVVRPDILLFGKYEGPQTITFRLSEGSGLRFPEKTPGIVVEGRVLDRIVTDREGKRAIALEPAGSEFECSQKDSTPTEFKCRITNQRFATFKYTVRVVDTQTGKEYVYDPGLVTGAEM